MPSAVSIKVPAPAKLNLFLHVTGRRIDGYHTLESVMVLLDFGDTLTVAARDDGRIEATHAIDGVARADDLSVRAARLLQQYTDTRSGATIELEKRIPIGAGMGGGSSDAASTLLALNRLWDTGLSRSELMQLGLQLGADVPFFIFGLNAHVSGIGESLRAVSMPDIGFVIVVPPVASATAEIFADPELARDTPRSSADTFAVDFGRNDLQPVAVRRHHAIATALEALDAVDFRAAGRNTLSTARMTGSGSAGFRIVDRPFPASAEAWKAAGTSERDAWKLLQRIHYRAPKAHDSNGTLKTGSRLIHARVIHSHPLRDFVAK
jgi:4-diphosphocytidyl-2-C-methyl-D-erythritol kinase